MTPPDETKHKYKDRNSKESLQNTLNKCLIKLSLFSLKYGKYFLRELQI